ncbi:DUF998 domain-containing protein [Pseudomonadales bacterium]|jgi:hypothetical protein|nr:DUF998 domain-containing protein [Pseudomonadales bacterium]MDG0999772.1 DUF998 domain-containing protein [Pseudomonadales bacterium]MDG1305445.1 DUF998 domain-containing protein [Pseudomonadales bacterium]MDG1834401.1 DUF998 domain-containing protein [Pseudomonadales bacterium]MDG1909164.1 DUF998 domain-containing protein [Pseudomonadales bacterium]|tara:strand:+ start:202 stop:819 length:618 start_codon:yes stop_codon:yes gene_type:complete
MNSKDVLLRTLCLTLFFSSIMLTEFIGFLRSDYNLINHFISELGAAGAEYSIIINYFGFLPIALSALTITLLLQSKFPNNRLSRAGLLLVGSGVFIGYFGAFIFPCDFGCPAEGSFSQNMHNNLGLIYYLIIPVGLFVLGIGLRTEAMIINASISFSATSIFLLGFFMMLNPSQTDLLGLWQRLADYTVVGFLIFMSLSAKGLSK